MEDADLYQQLSAALAKHVRVAQRSRRWASTLLPPVLCSCILCAAWQVFLTTRWQARGYIFSTLGSLLLLLGMIPALQQNVVDLVSEKESKMKALQEIYGLRRDAYWLSWLSYFFLSSLGSAAATLVLVTGFSGLFQHSDVQLTAFILLLGHLQLIAVSCCLSVAFDKADVAARTMHFASVVFVIFASGVCSIFRGGDSHMYYMASVVPTVSVHSALSSTFWLEAGDEGLTWRTLSAECCLPAGKDRTFLPVRDSIACTLLSLVAASIFLVLMCRVQCRWSQRSSPCQVDAAEKHRSSKDGARSTSAVAFVDLVKSFDSKVVVDHLNLDVRAAEIFALLGHNGAGKTTIINCLAGLMRPTSGSTAVNGWSPQHDARRAWRELSVCPQESPLHEELTVEEHLRFFGALRGEEDMSQQLESLCGALAALGLGGKQHDLGRHLSGGQRRRLWVATALLGHTPVVVLDEPSSGMDPPARRDLWDYLLKMRAIGRTVLFTTHYLEEADWYADRKAILALGRVQAVGTSRELKVKFGTGYHLKVEVSAATSPESKVEQLSGSSAALPAIKELVMCHVPAAVEASSGHSSTRSLQSTPTSSCHFVLPFSAINELGPLLGELDRLREEKFTNRSLDYSLQMTNLEDVFMKLGQQAADMAGAGESSASLGASNYGMEEDARGPEALPAVARRDVPFWDSVRALARIRVIAMWADGKTLKCQILLPGILLLVAFVRSSKASSMSEPIFVILCPLSYSFAAAGVGALLVKEREMKCQLLCISQGLPTAAYWIATLAVHALALLPLAGAVPVLASVFDTPYMNGPGLPLIVAECLVYPVVAVTFACTASLLFSTAEGAMKCLPLLSFACVSLPSCAVFALRVLGGAKRSASVLADILHYVFSITDPLYGLAGVLIHVISMSNPETRDGESQGCRADPYGGQQCPKASGGTQLPLGMLEHFASKAAFPLFCSPLLVAVMMAWLMQRGRPGAQSQKTCSTGFKEDACEHEEDEDVAAEALRIKRGLAQSQQVVPPASADLTLEGDALTCVDLRHTYVAQEGFNHAVRGISLGIRSGERFGLLGPNGAGKTTTLSILTGELWPPTAGRILVEGKNVADAGHKVLYSRLGLCPQVDALWPELTGRQHLLFYGRVKGVPEEAVAAEAEAILSSLGLSADDSDRRSETYSGGMKRKLAAGIALIGRPRLLVLDEPTAAVDAAGKRHLWQVIKRGGVHQTTLLTTHSMEEAEALCDRVAIQVLGRIRCLGSPTRLRLLHGRGYRLELITAVQDDRDIDCSKKEGLANSSHSALQHFVRERISADATLAESGPGRYLFELTASSPPGTNGASVTTAEAADSSTPQHTATLSPAAALTLIAAERQNLGIVDYCLWQPSLEQVFLRFAREQLDADGHIDSVHGG